MLSRDPETLTDGKKRSKSDPKKTLKLSFDKSLELYYSLFKLIIDLTDLQALRLDEAKHKFLPTDEDLNPNTRFIDNWLVEQLRDCEELQDYINEHNITWRDDELFLRLMLDKVLNSKLYHDYMSMPATDQALDCELWHQMLKRVLLVDDDLFEFVESKSIYWGIDDLNIIGQFVMKTIRRLRRATSARCRFRFHSQVLDRRLCIRRSKGPRLRISTDVRPLRSFRLFD